jgi:hypothetical protein
MAAQKRMQICINYPTGYTFAYEGSCIPETVPEHILPPEEHLCTESRPLWLFIWRLAKLPNRSGYALISTGGVSFECPPD